jgi:hypothetical protein
MPDDKLKVLYQNLVKDNYDLPDEATFRSDMSDETKRTKLHDNLVKDGYELPDVETFSVDMGFKKKVPTEPTSKNSGNGGSQDQGGYSVKVDDRPVPKENVETVTVGGKSFDAPNAPEMTSYEVNQTAKKLFKIASPITQSGAQLLNAHPDLTSNSGLHTIQLTDTGEISKTGQAINDNPKPEKPKYADPIFNNISEKVLKGNEDILANYIRKLPESEQNRLKEVKLNDEQSLELLNKAYNPLFEQSLIDMSILRDRGVEDDLKNIKSKQDQINQLVGTVQSDKDNILKLQTTYLTQNGYDKLAGQYKSVTSQLQSKQDEYKPLLDQKKQLENQLTAFTPMIKDGQFTGNKEDYDKYNQVVSQYQELLKSPEITDFNKLASQQGEIVKNINQIVTPEFKEKEKQLIDKTSTTINSINGLQTDLENYVTPERQQQIDQYQQAYNTFNGIKDKLQSIKSRLPDVVNKQETVDALNKLKDVSSSAYGYDLAARSWNSIASTAGQLLSAPLKFVGGTTNEYDAYDKAADSITNFFNPPFIASNTTVAGSQSKDFKPFYDSEIDKVNWSSIPGELADQVGGFLVLAGTGYLGGVAGLSDAAAIVAPGAMIAYNDAYKQGLDIYGGDPVKATAFGAARSYLSGITEMLQPDRDILTGGAFDEIAKKYVTSYVKEGRKAAIKEATVHLFKEMGLESTEELWDRWNDVITKGAINLGGGDVKNDLPTFNEQLSIAASTAALTAVGGVHGVMDRNSNAHKLAVYEAAKNYPETLKMLDAMAEDGGDAERINQIKNEVSNMFTTLKQIPEELSTPKKIAIAEKLKVVDEIQNQMVSGIHPIIAKNLEENIKVIQGQIEQIIKDPEFDKQFEQEVNQEVQPKEVAQNQTTEAQPTETAPAPIVEEGKGGEDVSVKKEIDSEKENIALAIEGARNSEDKTFDGATLDQLIEDQQLIENDPLKYYQNRASHFLKESKRDDISKESKERALEEVRLHSEMIDKLTPKINLSEDQLNEASKDLFDKSYSELTQSEKDDVESEALARVDYVNPDNTTPTPEGQTKEGITNTQNEKGSQSKSSEEAKGRQKSLLSSNESAKTEPVSKVEAQTKPTTEQRIESANKNIDAMAEHLKKVLRVDAAPKGVQKSGTDTEAIIDLIARNVKALVSTGIKTHAALDQVMKALKDGGFVSGKEITKYRNLASSQMDSDLEKVWVSGDGKKSVYVDEHGTLVAKNDKGKFLDSREENKVISEYTQKKELNKGKLADLNGVSEHEAERKIAEDSENPMQIAQAIANSTKKMGEDELDFKQRTIAEHLPMITTESFVHRYDISNLMDEKGKFQEGTSIAFNYLRKDGKTLDEAQLSINSSAGLEPNTITGQDIIDFILEHPKGRYQFFSNKNKNYSTLTEKFKSLTGFYPTPEILERSKSFDPYTESQDDFAGLEPIEKTDEVGTVAEPKEKLRAFTKQVNSDNKISGEFKAWITKDQLKYTTASASFLISVKFSSVNLG